MQGAAELAQLDAAEAKALLEILPRTPVRTALESFADLVATRTG